MIKRLKLILPIILSLVALTSILCGCNQTPPPATEEPPNGAYTISFYAGSELVGKRYFDDASSVINVPAVPKRVGYDGSWQPYVLGQENLTVYAVYVPKVYSIEYHVVNVKGDGGIEMDYCGGWDEVWCAKNPDLATYSVNRQYTIESETITIPSFSEVKVVMEESYKIFVSGFFIDEKCTVPFSGTIAKGTYGSLTLYAKKVAEDVGPY